MKKRNNLTAVLAAVSGICAVSCVTLGVALFKANGRASSAERDKEAVISKMVSIANTASPLSEENLRLHRELSEAATAKSKLIEEHTKYLQAQKDEARNNLEKVEKDIARDRRIRKNRRSMMMVLMSPEERQWLGEFGERVEKGEPFSLSEYGRMVSDMGGPLLEYTTRNPEFKSSRRINERAIAELEKNSPNDFALAKTMITTLKKDGNWDCPDSIPVEDILAMHEVLKAISRNADITASPR